MLCEFISIDDAETGNTLSSEYIEEDWVESYRLIFLFDDIGWRTLNWFAYSFSYMDQEEIDKLANAFSSGDSQLPIQTPGKTAVGFI